MCLFISVIGWFSCISTQVLAVFGGFNFFSSGIVFVVYRCTYPLHIFLAILEPPYVRGLWPCPFSLVRWDCSTDNGVTSSPGRGAGGGGGGTPPSDLWLGKTDELLLPPCFFARSILHVGVRFMNDGDLLKSSIQLPKDTALAPIVPTRQE